MTNRAFPAALSALRRAWWHWRGERPLVTTFWPKDYRRGCVHSIAGQDYRITRYRRVGTQGFFEVWGRAVHEPDAAVVVKHRPASPRKPVSGNIGT